MIVPSGLGGSGLTTLDNGFPVTRRPAADGASRFVAVERALPGEHRSGTPRHDGLAQNFAENGRSHIRPKAICVRKVPDWAQ
jgi:hypothetical protein